MSSWRVGVDAHDLQVPAPSSARRPCGLPSRLPGKHISPGLWFWPVEPGLLWENGVAMAGAVGGEVVALDDAGKSLAERAPPLTSTFCPTLKMSRRWCPGLELAQLALTLTANSCSTEPASVPASGESGQPSAG